MTIHNGKRMMREEYDSKVTDWDVLFNEYYDIFIIIPKFPKGGFPLMRGKDESEPYIAGLTPEDARTVGKMLITHADRYNQDMNALENKEDL